MAYSTIKKKHCRCQPDCPKWPTLGYSGYFASHSPKEILEKVGTKRDVTKRNRDARNRTRILINKKPNEEKNIQELWWIMVAAVIRANPRCWETNEYIPEKYYRAASCHILPKAIFPSVAHHPKNFLVLSASNGSHDKTHRIDTFCKMKVWPIAVDRFLEILPYVKERHKILDLFKEKIEYLKTEK